MRSAIILNPNNYNELNLIIDLAKKLGIDYLEIETDNFVKSEINKELSEILFEGLNIPKKVNTFQLSDLSKEVKSLNNYNSTKFLNAMNEVGGAWEEDEGSLEEVLEILK